MIEMENNKDRFAPTVDGCKEAKEWLNSIGAWSPRLERMDGYSIVFHANELYNQPKSDDTELN